MSTNRYSGPGRLLSIILAGLSWCGMAQLAGAELVLQKVYLAPARAGAMPFSEAVQGADGNFYGTIPANNQGNAGAIFRLTPAGTFTTLVSFYGSNGRDPEAGLARAKDGNLYGTTFSGGLYGLGTLFKITPAGGYQLLHAFNGIEGANPQYTLLQASDGYLYGVTAASSTNAARIFRVSTTGTLVSLTNLNNALGDATATPSDGLMQGPDGWLYGTAAFSSLRGSRIGAIYKVATNGTFKTLATFPSTSKERPIGGLTAGNDGFLYGTLGHDAFPLTPTPGKVFRMTTNGILTTLFQFSSANGANPMTRLLMANDGAFYGLTTEGSVSNNGTIFRITTEGVLTTLASGFGALGVSMGPPPLMQAADGNLYGTGCSGSPSAASPFLFRLVPPPALAGEITSGGKTTLVWNSFTNATYQVGCKDSVAGTNWTTLGSIVATGATTSVSYSPGSATQRFYRVVLLP